jgi:hypothetical protein
MESLDLPRRKKSGMRSTKSESHWSTQALRHSDVRTLADGLLFVDTQQGTLSLTRKSFWYLARHPLMIQ